MKKLLLLATFAVAGVISAKDNSVTKTEIKKQLHLVAYLYHIVVG
ncbi:hypothetical protein [Chryseobacterium piperi]|nr:hypothetical protein [Chryseobacterium piperi]